MWKVALGVLLSLVLAGPVLAAPEFKPVHIFQDAAAATGNGTALQVQGWGTLGVQVVIADTATVTFEGTVDESNWVSAVCSSIASTSGALVTTATASGMFQCNVAGFAQFRVRVSAFTGGTVTVKGLTTLITKRGGSGGGGAATSVASSDDLPVTCTQGDIYHDNNATSGERLAYCDSTNTWVVLLTAETQTLDQAFDQGKVIDGATSEASAFCVGGDAASKRVCIWHDASTGLHILPDEAANTKTEIMTNQTWSLFDVEGDANVETVDPDAASTLAMWTYGTAYRPKKSILLTADSFYMKSGCTLTTDAALITGGLTEPYITCTDNDASGFHRTLMMPDAWDGGTFTLKVALTNVNATPADNYEIDFSAECEANSEVIGTSISATGEQPAAFDFDNTGTCSTACAQFDLAAVTTAAITPNGTCAGGNLLRLQGLVDATATTTAQVADVKIISVRMEYSVTSRSD